MLWNLKETFRSILRRPGFSCAVILLLASGIALNAAFFTVFNAVLLRALPYPESDRLFTIWEESAKEGKFRSVVNPTNYTDWSSGSRAFQKSHSNYSPCRALLVITCDLQRKPH